MTTRVADVGVVALLVLLGACASGPSPEQLRVADYGAEVSAQDAEQMIRAYFDQTLKDSESARYKFSPPAKGWLKPDPSIWGETFYGRLVEVQVNAKNSYGGYTGYEAWKFLIRDGQFVAAVRNDGGAWGPVFYQGSWYIPPPRTDPSTTGP